MSALRFLYKKVLKRRDLSFDDRVYPKKPKKLPGVLSPEEVARLIEAATNTVHRTMLMVLYGTGIRRTEASLLRVCDIDSQPRSCTSARAKALVTAMFPRLPVHSCAGRAFVKF